jgi:adenylate cyclase
MARKLAGFLVADAVGYSARIEADEAEAIKALTRSRSFIDSALANHSGVIFSTAGDNVIALFATAVDAVRAALDIQKAISSCKEDVLEMRIGVHFGDVSDDGDTLLGDGLNVAARLEPLAPEGGILITVVVADQLVGKVEDKFVSVGKRTVKNISRQLDLYCWPASAALGMKRGNLLHRWPLAVALIALVAVSLALNSLGENDEMPTGPRVAVLAFDDLSAGDDKGYLSDGVAEGLLTELSRYRELGVIARNSSFRFRDSGLGIQDIADELRADYVIEGSKQKSGDQIRITVQLIDGHDGTHIWAEDYDADIGDLFEVQDRVVREITNRIGREVTWKPPSRGGREVVGALHFFMKGLEQFQMATSTGTLAARDFFEVAIETDPKAPYGYVGLVWVHWRDLWSNEIDPVTPRNEKLRRAAALADKALALDPEYHLAHVARADIHVAAGELQEALIRYDSAAELNPNDVLVMVGSTDPLVFLGRGEEAIALLEKAIDLDPITPAWYFQQLAWAHWSIGQCEEGLVAIRRMAKMNNNALRVLAALYVCDGDIEAARETMANFREVNPERTVSKEIELFGTSWRDPDTMKRWAEALRLAGMPEGPQ